MGTKQNNFKTALNELMAGKIGTDEASDQNVNNADFGMTGETETLFKNTPAISYPPQTAAMSILSKDLIIDGNIRSKSGIRIDGHVKGSIKCDGAIACTGTVEGDVECEAITMIGCKIIGNLCAKSDVNIDADSLLIGDVKSSNLSSNGRIKGNIDASDTATLKGRSMLLGNISARSIALDTGCALKGTLDVKSAALSDENFKFEKVKPPVTKAEVKAPVQAPIPTADETETEPNE